MAGRGYGCVAVVMDSEKGAFGLPSKTFSYKMTAIRGEHCRWDAEQKAKRAALDLATESSIRVWVVVKEKGHLCSIQGVEVA